MLETLLIILVGGFLVIVALKVLVTVATMLLIAYTRDKEK